jgi:hypothetical protein
MYTPYIYTWFWPTLHIYTHIHPYPYPHPTVHKILPQPQSNTAHSTTKKLAFAAGPKLLVAGRAIGHAHASAPAPMYLPVRVYMCASVCVCVCVCMCVCVCVSLKHVCECVCMHVLVCVSCVRMRVRAYVPRTSRYKYVAALHNSMQERAWVCI